MSYQLEPELGDLVRVRLPLMAGDAPFPQGLVIKKHATKRRGIDTVIYEVQEYTEGKILYCSKSDLEVV